MISRKRRIASTPSVGCQPARSRLSEMTGERFVSIGLPERHSPPAEPSVGGGLRAIRIHPADNVAVAIHALAAGERVDVDGDSVVVGVAVAPGHKLALRDIEQGDSVVKYGYPIGAATATIARGAWVHSHNLRTRLEGTIGYEYSPAAPARAAEYAAASFDGFKRGDGRVGTRNEIWVLNTVGCVNHAAERIARQAAERIGASIDGVHT